ncbi:MAG: redoxin family protein [Minisyncoccia bacterium]
MLLFLLVAFAAGILTVLAPCVLPLLPVIVGGSLAGGRSARHAATIAISLAASVFLFTLLIKVSTAFIGVPEEFWRIFSGILLIGFGLLTLWPALYERAPGVTALYRKSNQALAEGHTRSGIMGDIIAGVALGPVFSSCSPTYFVILAAILPAHFAVGTLYLLAYVIGLGGFLFVIGIAGQRLADSLGVAFDSRGILAKIIGILFILLGAAVIFGLDAKLEALLPQSFFGETLIEEKLLGGTTSTASSTAPTPAATSSPSASNETGPKAPELAGIAGYINTGGQPITLAQYVGKDVVLVDFWDYSCINCERTTPYLNAWYQKYKNDGFVIIGVHTPEFAFEHLLANVQAAVTQFGIMYPVVLDNNYDTWNAYQNEYWPAEYLIGKDGAVIYTHFGEGNYDETEGAIQKALDLSTSTTALPGADLSTVESPETYFGSNRNEYLGNGTPGISGVQAFTLPASPTVNTLYLGGSWQITPEYAQGGSGASVLYEYDAQDIYMVAAPGATGAAQVEIFLDGAPFKTLTIDADKLYTLAMLPSAGVHTLRLEVTSGTLDAYTFTFG